MGHNRLFLPFYQVNYFSNGGPSCPINLLIHDDVIKWKHFRVTGSLCGEFTGPRWIPLTKASDAEVFFHLRLTDSWANNGTAGDLRSYRAHYDVIVISTECANLWDALYLRTANTYCVTFYPTKYAHHFGVHDIVEIMIPILVDWCDTFTYIPQACFTGTE